MRGKGKVWRDSHPEPACPGTGTVLGVKKSPSVLGGTTFKKGGLYLEVSALGTEPFLDEVLGVGAKAKHEVSLGLQLVDGLNSLMDLEKRCKCQMYSSPRDRS